MCATSIVYRVYSLALAFIVRLMRLLIYNNSKSTQVAFNILVEYKI